MNSTKLPYFNLGVAQDKAENYKAAIQSLKLALLATPGNKEIKPMIYEIEYRDEKAHSPEVMAARQASSQQEQQEAFLTSSPTLAFGHRLRAKEGDSYGATHEKPRA